MSAENMSDAAKNDNNSGRVYQRNEFSLKASSSYARVRFIYIRPNDNIWCTPSVGFSDYIRFGT